MKKNLLVCFSISILVIVIAGILFYPSEQQSYRRNKNEADVYQRSTNSQEASLDNRGANSAKQLPESSNLTRGGEEDISKLREKSEQTSRTKVIEQLQDMNDPLITDDQAIAKARKAIGAMSFHEEGDIIVERVNGLIRVRFPVNKNTPPGTTYRGPSFAAEVEIDAKTGEVLQRRLGG